MREVFFALVPQVVLLDVAGPAEAFRIANQKAPGSYRLRFVAPRKSVRAAIGLSLSPLEALPRIVDGLQDEGYELVTLDEMVAA